MNNEIYNYDKTKIKNFNHKKKSRGLNSGLHFQNIRNAYLLKRNLSSSFMASKKSSVCKY
jgi:hypothetical protein